MNPGDKVRWTHTSSRGRTMSMRLREGVLVSVEAGIATVRLASKKTTLVPAARLSVEGQPTDIDRVVTAMRQSAHEA